MADAFKILAGFLERFGDDVEGRELGEPSAELKGQLERLAQGDLPEAQQTELFAQLNRNPQWLAWLAQQVKGMRGGAA